MPQTFGIQSTRPRNNWFPLSILCFVIGLAFWLNYLYFVKRDIEQMNEFWLYKVGDREMASEHMIKQMIAINKTIKNHYSAMIPCAQITLGMSFQFFCLGLLKRSIVALITHTPITHTPITSFTPVVSRTRSAPTSTQQNASSKLSVSNEKGEAVGEYEIDDIRKMLKSGTLKSNDEFWDNVSGQWLPFSQLK